MSEVQGVSRGRMLTADEAERFRKIREQEAAGAAELEAQNRDLPGHRSLDDAREVKQLVAFLRAERERQQLDLAEIARRTRYSVDELAVVEAGETNPPLALLSRYARALGKQVILSLRQGDTWREARTAATEAH